MQLTAFATIARPMRTLIVLAALACLINTAAMALGDLAKDPVTFGITYLNASATGYLWLAFSESTRRMMTFRDIAARLRRMLGSFGIR
jgi:hypothetical protein